MLFFVLLPKPHIDDISAFFNDILAKKVDLIPWISYNVDLSLVPLAVWLGALYPDIDFIWIFRKWHRQLFHNIFAVALPAIVMVLIFAWFNRFDHGRLVAGAFLLGCFVHILTDSITPMGTYLLWPFSKEFRLRFPIITTGSNKETIIMIIAFVAFVVYVVYVAWIYILQLSPFFLLDVRFAKRVI